jgi:hypothetical protein
MILNLIAPTWSKFPDIVNVLDTELVQDGNLFDSTT